MLIEQWNIHCSILIYNKKMGPPGYVNNSEGSIWNWKSGTSGRVTGKSWC